MELYISICAHDSIMTQKINEHTGASCALFSHAVVSFQKEMRRLRQCVKDLEDQALEEEVNALRERSSVKHFQVIC